MIVCRNCEYFDGCDRYRTDTYYSSKCPAYTPMEKKTIKVIKPIMYPQTFEFSEYVKTHNCWNCNREFCDYKFIGQQSFHTCANWEEKPCKHTIVKCESKYTSQDVITTVCEECGETVNYKRVG